MTIVELRKEMDNKIRFAELANTGLKDYYVSAKETFNELYDNGTVTNFSNDFLAFANGFQVRNGEYERLHILQTYDLHRITANRIVVRRMMSEFLYL